MMVNREEYKSLQVNEKTYLYSYFLLIFNVIFMMWRYVYAITACKSRIVSLNPVYIVVSVCMPFVAWVFSTETTCFNFYKRKIKYLKMAVVNAALTFTQFSYALCFRFLVRYILMIPTNEAMTGEMLMILSAAVEVIAIIIPLYFCKVFAKAYVFSEIQIENIENFKIKHHLRENLKKEHTYNLFIMRDMKTGKDIPIRENDRFVHGLIVGASGLGKTSMSYGPAIACDLNKKAENRNKRLELLEDMLENGEAYIGSNFINPSEADVVPEEAARKKYEQIYREYPDCGITVIAPNNSLNENIIKMAAAKKIWVNVLDPAEDYSMYPYVRMVGMNPFVIPFNLDEEKRVIQIMNIGSNFAEVLQAANEVYGKSDTYFRDINTSATSNIAIVCMLYRNINHEQTDIIEIQACIGNFSLLEPMVKGIEEHYNISISVQDVEKKQSGFNVQALTMKEPEEQTDSDDGRENPYYAVIQYVKQELLGPGAAKMFDQARGLRNLINKLLLDPRVKRILTAKDNYIDFDEILSNNEITLVNTALEFGQQTSTALGLFFLLNFKIAVERRPKNKRSDHFVYTDEAAQYMHQVYEDMIALYRQYRVANMFAIQSLSQFGKNELTKYLQGVFKGVGLFVVFGRITDDEMDVFEKMAGKKTARVIQDCVTKTSLISEETSYTESKRFQKGEEAILSGTKMRNRDFQEVTVFRTDKGRVLEAASARMDFNKDSDFEPYDVYEVDFKMYVNTVGSQNKKPDEQEKKSEESLISRGLISQSDEAQGEEQPQKTLPEVSAYESEYDEDGFDMAAFWDEVNKMQ